MTGKQWKKSLGKPGHVFITYNTTFQKFWPLGFCWMSKPRSSVLLRECPGWHPCRTTKTLHFFLSISLLLEAPQTWVICTTRHLISNALPLYTPYHLVCGLLLVTSGALARHQNSWQVSMTCQSPQLCRLCHTCLSSPHLKNRISLDFFCLISRKGLERSNVWVLWEVGWICV